MLARSRAFDLFCFFAAALVAGAYLFQVPGYHYDEAWIADLGAKIAFDPGFWPTHGMNDYTVPVISYLLAFVFKVLGYPSLPLARLTYAGLNVATFALLYGWVRRVRPAGSGLFTALWCTLPLAVFNQRLCLEVTSGFAFCAALVLWSITLGVSERGRAGWLSLGVLATWLGVASHVLFLTLPLGLLWAAWRVRPELLERRPVRAAFTAIFLPFLAFLAYAAAGPVGPGTRIKAAIAAALLGLLLLGLWQGWAESARPQRAASALERPLAVIAGVGTLFFLLFGVLGVWPTSQSTGYLPYYAAIPGALLILAVLPAIARARREPLVAALAAAAQVITALTILTIYKPSSAKYWELTLLCFLLLAALAPITPRESRFLRAAVAGNLAVLLVAYFGLTLFRGPTRDPIRWLWVKDSARYYLPVIPPYEWLRERRLLCAGQEIRMDEGRVETVLEIYRRLATLAGAEPACPPGAPPSAYVFARATPAAAAELVSEAAPGWSELRIYRLGPPPAAKP